MTKAKAGPAARAAKQAGIQLRAAITKQLRDGGPQSALQVHAVIGGNADDVQQALYRMCKAGTAKAARGSKGKASTYSIAESTTVARNVANPHRPVVREWASNNKRDSLVAALFGAPAAA